MVKALLPPGKELMHIRLVPNIEHQSVFCGIKDSLNGHAQLHHTQIGGQVSAGTRYMLDQKGANFPAELGLLLPVQAHQVLVAVDRL